MKLFPITAEHFKLDGGACFGVVPKTIWQKYLPADENNLVKVTSRCLLAETGNRLILVDTGMGNKQSERYFSFFHRFGEENLETSFAKAGYSFDQVTDVILTHLHFDHVGGAVKNGSLPGTYEPVFPNATYYVSREQWDWTLNPNPREKASFFPENYLPLYENGQLEFIHEPGTFAEGVEIEFMNGHTRGLMVPIFDYKGRKVVFTTDFIAMVYNIPLPYVPGFDVEPLESMKEKETFLQRALEQDFVLCFQHDHFNECCTLQMTGKGIREKEIFKLADI
ncbi:MAG: MBL fold metallo-hydrolase [Bacteroides sp.]|jgi:glyoxylase-like metal-dependent hydrolase (beta-lactamase superfamily II)|nr:MBL fold metallo-hydrolase [Bacteroides sp.]